MASLMRKNAGLNLHYHVVDHEDRQALIPVDSCVWHERGLSERVKGLRIFETGVVVKLPLPLSFKWEANPPLARPLKGILKSAPHGRFAPPLQFTIGYVVEHTQFEVPSAYITDALYDRLPQENQDERNPSSPAATRETSPGSGSDVESAS